MTSTAIRLRCSGAWCQGLQIRDSCGWWVETSDPPVPRFLAASYGRGIDHETRCPACGGSIVFYRPGFFTRIRERLQTLGYLIRQDVQADDLEAAIRREGDRL